MSPALCVQCREQDVDARWRPFCSERCKLIDLGRWLAEDYRIPADPESSGDDRNDDQAPGHTHSQ